MSIHILLWSNCQVMNDETGYVMFKGKKHTIVTYDPEKKVWIMRVTNNPGVYATSASNFQNLLMGKDIYTNC